MFPTSLTNISDDYLDTLTAKYMPKHTPIPYDETLKKQIKVIAKKAYLEAVADVLKTGFKRELVCQLSEGNLTFCKDIQPELLKLMESQSDRITTKSPYYFITINPKSGITLEELRNAVEHKKKSLINKKCVKSYMLVYEIRNKDEKKYTGLHCHILLEQTDKPHNFKRGVKNTFKNICDINNPHILNFKNIPDESTMKQKVLYMLGEKTDKKKKGVSITQEWRKTISLPDYIESSPLLPCRVTQKMPLINEVE